MLATFLHNKFTFPNKTERQRKFITNFESIYKKFYKSGYEKLLSHYNVRLIFRLIKDSGILKSIIAAYPKLYEIEELYFTVYQSIQDFSETKELMQ